MNLFSGDLTSLNTRCFSQLQGVPNNAEINFACPSPGLVGNTVTVQNLGNNLEVLEIEVLGIFWLSLFGSMNKAETFKTSHEK